MRRARADFIYRALAFFRQMSDREGSQKSARSAGIWGGASVASHFDQQDRNRSSADRAEHRLGTGRRGHYRRHASGGRKQCPGHCRHGAAARRAAAGCANLRHCGHRRQSCALWRDRHSAADPIDSVRGLQPRQFELPALYSRCRHAKRQHRGRIERLALHRWRLSAGDVLARLRYRQCGADRSVARPPGHVVRSEFHRRFDQHYHTGSAAGAGRSDCRAGGQLRRAVLARVCHRRAYLDAAHRSYWRGLGGQRLCQGPGSWRPPGPARVRGGTCQDPVRAEHLFPCRRHRQLHALFRQFVNQRAAAERQFDWCACASAGDHRNAAVDHSYRYTRCGPLAEQVSLVADAVHI